MSTYTDCRRRSLEALIGIVGIGVFTAGPDLKIRSMNAEAERLLGFQPGEAAGLSCRETLGPDLCSSTCAFRMTFIDRSPRKDWTVRVTNRRGEARDLLLSTAFLDAPEPAEQEVAVILRDVTEAEQIRKALRDRWTFHGLVCASGKMKEIVSLVRELAPYDSTVLILGESGTGKEIIAHAVHEESPRKSKPFVTVNCSAYPEGLLESELFGHVRGAFTGAFSDRKGRFVAANGGTLFLDEIGEISAAVQVKLLRVLQDHVIERVGDQKPIPVDLRVVAATNRDLREEVRTGRFREDLYYRLNVITVHLPPLRERREDVPALTDHFLGIYTARTGKTVQTVSDETMDLLLRHDWPGNVRELENAIEHAVVRAHGAVLTARDLPPEVRRQAGGTPLPTGNLSTRIDAALAAAGGRVGRAAEILGVHRTTVWRHIRRRQTV